MHAQVSCRFLHLPSSRVVCAWNIAEQRITHQQPATDMCARACTWRRYFGAACDSCEPGFWAVRGRCVRQLIGGRDVYVLAREPEDEVRDVNGSQGEVNGS